MRPRVSVLLPAVLVCVFVLSVAAPSSAQSLGTFRWQLQPYCNVITLNIAHTGANFAANGTDDLCGGAPSPAAVVGLAFPKPDGTIGLGLTIVLAPSGVPVHVSASISPANLSGPWQDSSGGSGSLVFNPAIAPGTPRPFPKPAFASGLSAVNARITEVGGPVAASDATNKTYVDTAIVSGPRDGWLSIYGNATFWARSANLAGATVQRLAGQPAGVYCVGLPAGSGLNPYGTVAVAQNSVGVGGVPGLISLMSFFSGECQAAGFAIGVYTYNFSSGVFADRSFTLQIPRQ